jgi:tRNA (guanine-N7-)-methyltransferase
VSDDGAPQRWLYGRRRGRALRPGQRVLLDTLLPVLRFALPASGEFDPRSLFSPKVEEIWLEVGFGAGEHLAAQARANPGCGLIGCEVFENGIVKLLAEAKRDELGNLRLFIDDARLLIAALRPASLARAFILFPDPWPKERHKKRRIVSRQTLDELARAMRDGAELRLATDDMDYAQAMRERVGDHADFELRPGAPDDGKSRAADWPITRYEQKAVAAGRRPVFLRFRRRARRGSEV